MPLATLIKALRYTLSFAFIVLMALPVSALELFDNGDIPLLNNRFRIDHSIEKATFLLYRDEGSPAAILVRPDGSKIYSWALPDEVTWLETDALDIVTIEKPMRGPWQAIAENKGRNRIRVLSDVSMTTDFIATQVYQGEKIKITARLNNAGEHIDLGAMIKDAMMSISMIKDITEETSNRILRPKLLGKFYDDGKDYDEYSEDGVFTTYIDLDVPAGKYELIISTINQVFTRAKRQMILVYPKPVSVEVNGPKGDIKQAILELKIDSDEIDPTSVVVDGMVYNNVGWEQDFKIYAENYKSQHALPTPKEQGRYRVDGMLYANTLSGREVVIELSEDDFVVLPPPPPPPEPVVVVVEPETGMPVWLSIVFSVLGIVLVVGLAFLFIWWRKRLAFKAALAAATQPKETTSSENDPPLDSGDSLKMP